MEYTRRTFVAAFGRDASVAMGIGPEDPLPVDLPDWIPVDGRMVRKQHAPDLVKLIKYKFGGYRDEVRLPDIAQKLRKAASAENKTNPRAFIRSKNGTPETPIGHVVVVIDTEVPA